MQNYHILYIFFFFFEKKKEKKKKKPGLDSSRPLTAAVSLVIYFFYTKYLFVIKL